MCILLNHKKYIRNSMFCSYHARPSYINITHLKSNWAGRVIKSDSIDCSKCHNFCKTNSTIQSRPYFFMVTALYKL